MKVAARQAGEDILDSGMGNPDRPTRLHIVNKPCEATPTPRAHSYSTSRNVAAYCGRRCGVEIDPDCEAIVTLAFGKLSVI